jgi:hypothetical protein
MVGLLTAVVVWSLLAILLWWGWLPGPVRRLLALLAGGVGIVFLVCALRSEGVRETTTTMAFLMGPTSVTEQSIASASLSYYILTAIGLLLGTVGLVLGDESSQALRKHALGLAIVLSFAVALLRFCLEKVAAHPILVRSMGVVWLPPVVGAFFSWNLRREGKGFRSLLRDLLVYAFSVRAFVTVLLVAATVLRLGSHYDLSSVVEVHSPFFAGPVHFEPGSFRQIMDLGVLPQLVFWTTYTVVTGFLGALLERVLGLPGVSTPVQAPLAAAAKEGG